MNPFFLRLIVSLGVVAASPVLAQQRDEDLIPPEILEQMDPDILSGSRPTIAELTPDGIFGLRQQPHFDADFVRLHGRFGRLPTVKNKILADWLSAGHNDVLLMGGGDMSQWAKYFGLSSRQGNNSWDVELTRHPVNTDCKLLRGYIAFQKPRSGTVVITSARGDPSAGSFPWGQNTIYFFDEHSGADSRRWYLNYMHWALGLPVPGTASTETGGVSQRVTLADNGS